MKWLAKWVMAVIYVPVVVFLGTVAFYCAHLFAYLNLIR